jgi:hypothetical protein
MFDVEVVHLPLDDIGLQLVKGFLSLIGHYGKI